LFLLGIKVEKQSDSPTLMHVVMYVVIIFINKNYLVCSTCNVMDLLSQMQTSYFEKMNYEHRSLYKASMQYSLHKKVITMKS